MGTPPPARPLWDKLEAIRIENGWTRSQLAQRAGVARTTLEKWKIQPRAPLAPTIKSVAERLGIDYLEALDLAGITRAEPGPTAPTEPTERPSKIAEALEIMRQATEALRLAAEDPDVAREVNRRLEGMGLGDRPPDTDKPKAADSDRNERRDTA